MIDHLSLGVSDLDRSLAFYEPLLATIGVRRIWRNEKGAGFGAAGPDESLALFAVGADTQVPGRGWHLALAAPSRSAVNEFHRVATQQGGLDEGSPGLRPQYGPGYYAAFVRDPDGYKLEAVFHEKVPKGA